MFVKNSQETVRTCLNRTRTLTKAEEEKGGKCGNGRFRPGRMDPEPYDVRENSRIWRIEPTAHRIYSGPKTSVLAFCRVLLPEKHSYKATLKGKNPILLHIFGCFRSWRVWQYTDIDRTENIL